jgi:ketosteroid isomerase-like protein
MGNVELLRSMYDAFASGDVATVLGAMDPQIEWREAEGNPYQLDGSAWVGPDAITENLFMKLVTEWEGFTVSPKEFHDAGDTVVVEGRYGGKVQATGAAVDSQFCHVFRFRDGRVCAFQQYTDTAQFQKAMGVTP